MNSIVTKLLVLVLAVNFDSSIGIGIWQHFIAKVLLLVLTIVFTSLVNLRQSLLAGSTLTPHLISSTQNSTVCLFAH